VSECWSGRSMEFHLKVVFTLFNLTNAYNRTTFAKLYFTQRFRDHLWTFRWSSLRFSTEIKWKSSNRFVIKTFRNITRKIFQKICIRLKEIQFIFAINKDSIKWRIERFLKCHRLVSLFENPSHDHLNISHFYLLFLVCQLQREGIFQPSATSSNKFSLFLPSF
jgi:hypothetical protein